MTSLEDEAGYLDEMWLVDLTWEQFLVRDAASGGEMCGSVPKDLLRAWFEGRKRQVTDGLRSMGLADLV